MTETEFYIFNETGLIPEAEIEAFVLQFLKKSKLGFTIDVKKSLKDQSTVDTKLISGKLEVTVYKYGYAIKVEGPVLLTIMFLSDFDLTFDAEKIFYVSPIQAIQNQKKWMYPRKAKIETIADFLDAIFNSTTYSSSLTTI